MTNKTMKNLQIAWKSIIYADSTGDDSSGADNTVSKKHSSRIIFRALGLKISTSKEK